MSLSITVITVVALYFQDGRSPLHLAAAAGYVVLCSYLQDKLGSDMKDYVNSRDKVNAITIIF